MFRLLERVKLVSLLILEFSVYVAMLFAIYFFTITLCAMMDKCATYYF